MRFKKYLTVSFIVLFAIAVILLSVHGADSHTDTLAVNLDVDTAAGRASGDMGPAPSAAAASVQPAQPLPGPADKPVTVGQDGAGDTAQGKPGSAAQAGQGDTSRVAAQDRVGDTSGDRQEIAYQDEAGDTSRDKSDGFPPDSPELEAYKGPVRHIFFHPLIIYPERAFKSGSLSKGFNDWFVTVPEFRKIIESIYENNYILVSMDSVFTIEEQNGIKTVKRREMLLPKGKKPLVVSIDDMNYYDYMVDDGCASRLYIDGQGYTAVESKGGDGAAISSDDDIVPIMDEFVRLHPDFSLDGAKGVIALTGYEGVMGYRTNKTDSPGYEADKALAEGLANELKAEGWSFACHGYGHLDAVKVSAERLEKDCERWREEVEPITGNTPVYIYPYGSSLKFADKKFKLLKDNGFSIFCGVGPDGDIEFKGDFAYLERKSVDGISIYKNSSFLKDLFDCAAVLDPLRPKDY